MTTRPVLSALALAGALALGACAPAAPEMNAPADLAAVTALRTNFQNGFNAGDAAAIMNGYSADPISMGNHQPTATGRDAVMASNKALFEAMKANIEIIPDETKTMGNMGYERGHFKITMTPKAGGPPIMDEGRYFITLEKGADGAWKVTRDIDNSSLPLPPPPPPPPAKGGK